MNQTYDPILESVPLRRIRATAPRGAAMGTAIVLERSTGDPVVVPAGRRIPDAHVGNYTVLHRVDVANRGIGCTLTTPSADHAFPFTVSVTCGCQVTDPVAIVCDGVRDMAGALQAWLTNLVRSVSVRHDALRPADAEADIVAALHHAYQPDGIRLSGFAVTVTTNDTAEIVTAKREGRVLDIRRDNMRPVAHGGREELLTHFMAMTGGDPTPLLDREQDAKEANTRASLAALSALMGSDKIEEFDTSRISTKVMGEFFPGSEPPLRRPGIRDRLDRKKAIEPGPVVDAETGKSDAKAKPEAKPEATAESGGSGEPDGKRRSRVRGALRAEDE